jgi:hypothetical protein
MVFLGGSVLAGIIKVCYSLHTFWHYFHDPFKLIFAGAGLKSMEPYLPVLAECTRVVDQSKRVRRRGIPVP